MLVLWNQCNDSLKYVPALKTRKGPFVFVGNSPRCKSSSANGGRQIARLLFIALAM
jgi:hypothetical protein